VNRHDRRASAKREPPPGYLRAADWLDARVGRMVAGGWASHHYAIVGDLGDFGGRLARNDAARELVSACAALEEADRPTISMLAVVLARRGLRVERLALGELGEVVPMSRGGAS
jgi:hypothetical protein